MVTGGPLVYCSARWRASRSDTQQPTPPVEHVCAQLQNHGSPCRCACGAVNRQADTPRRGPWLMSRAAAQYLGITQDALTTAVRAGVGPRSYQRDKGAAYRFLVTDLEEWARQQERRRP